MENKLPANCNQCPNGCPADDLHCNKGKAYFERLKNGEEAVLLPSDNPLVKLLTACAKVAGHKSVKMREHGADESSMFKCLSDEEQAQLQSLLSKLQKTWKEDHERHHKAHKH